MSILKGIKILIGPSTFAVQDRAPLQRLEEIGATIVHNPYKRRLVKSELMELLENDVTGLIAGLEILDREVMTKSKLKVISRCGAGISNVDLKAAQELGIKVCYTPNGPTTAVAELTVGALFCLLRSIHIMDRELHQNKWSKITGRQLERKTVVIVGFGRIGRKVASLLVPFGVKILAVDVNTGQPVDGVTFCSLEEALPLADIISIHVSGNEEIFGREEFKNIKNGALLLNAARGEAVNEKCLIEALENGTVGGAWMDTFVQEPYAGRLQKYPQVLLTPHVGSYTTEGRLEMEMETVENLISAFKESHQHAAH